MKPMINSLNDPYKVKEVTDLVREIMHGGRYTEWENVGEFEQLVSEFYEGQPTLAFSNCGAALFTVFRWMKQWGHDKIVVPNNTFYATAAMAAEAGLQPVVCDTNVMDPSMSFDSMVAALEASGARAVCLCHIAGWLATDYEKIASYCKTNGIVLIEDAAHAFGVIDNHGNHAGSMGTCAVFSFYPTKAVPGGEGGALVTSNESLFAFAERFRNWGKEKGADGVIRYAPGFNLRMSEFDAAVLRVQMRHLDEIMANRLNAAKQLEDAGYECLMGKVSAYSNYHKYPVLAERLPENIRRAGQVYGTTDLTCVAAQVYNLQRPVSLHNSYEWSARHICLPLGENMYEGMTSKEIRNYLENGQ